MKYKIIRPPLEARFHLPSKDDLFRVVSGDHVKLMFQVSDDIIERMWVMLEECHDSDEWTGTLDNDPVGEKNARVLKHGKEIKFHPYDVIDIINQGTPEMAQIESILNAVRQDEGDEKVKWCKKPEVLIPGVVIPIIIAGVTWYLMVTDSNKMTQAESTEPAVVSTSTESASEGVFLLSELLSKALGYETVAERQDFLTKYKDQPVEGESAVSEVSRSGSGFIVDFYVERQMISCHFEGNEVNEQKFLLMKGKKISFAGNFSYSNIFGHGLALDDCVIVQI